MAVAKRADRTVYHVGIPVEPNRRKCRVWNSRGHVTMLPMAVPDAEFSAVWFVAERFILKQKCLKKWVGSALLRNTTVQLSSPYTDPGFPHYISSRTDDSFMPVDHTACWRCCCCYCTLFYCIFKIYSSIRRLSSRKCVIKSVFSVRSAKKVDISMQYIV